MCTISLIIWTEVSSEMKQYTKQKTATFKERFTELCDSSPKSDTAIANDLHVSKQTVCCWKSGVRSPKQPMVITIANYFGVSITWLMGFDVPREQNEPKKTESNDVPKTEEAKILSKVSTSFRKNSGNRH